MKQYRWIAAAALSLTLPVAAVLADTTSDAALEAQAKEIHQRVLTLDSHVDVLLPNTPKRYWGKDGKSAAELSKLKQGGIDVVALAIAVGPGPRTQAGDAEARAEADEKLRAIQKFIKDNSRDVALALTSKDIERLHREGKIAVIESFLNARSIGHDPAAIDGLYSKGVRLFGFTHAGNNDFADSSRPQGEPAEEHHGLSPLGQQAVARLNRLGIIVDVSQLTPAGLQQVLQLTKAPVVASHSAARTLVDNTRNLSDAELDAIARNGGVVHVPPFNAYLAKLPPGIDEKAGVLRAEFGLPKSVANRSFSEGYDKLPQDKQDQFLARLTALLPHATIANYVDHIDYIAKRIGVDHVGIGSDFNHGSGVPGFSNEGDAPNVTRELVRRGYTKADIAKIWGGNFLRVFREVEAVSGKLQGA